MTENRIGFLCNIATKLSSINSTHKVLKSYYLMRCNEITKGYGLPAKSFSSRVRCSYCYLEWTKDSDVKIKSIKLSKTQRKKRRAQMKLGSNNFEQKPGVRENEMIQSCTFCRHSTTTQVEKPPKEFIKDTSVKKHSIAKEQNQTKLEVPALKKPKAKKGSAKKSGSKNESTVNLYSNAFDVFSLKNDKNTLSSAIKKPATVIKNSKKKKDKFAGLCQKAVLASAKQKQQKEEENPPEQNKLNLFLKPLS